MMLLTLWGFRRFGNNQIIIAMPAQCGFQGQLLWLKACLFSPRVLTGPLLTVGPPSLFSLTFLYKGQAAFLLETPS